MATSVVFFGTPDFSAVSLKALLENHNFTVKLVITQPDRPAGRGQKLSFSPVKELALKHQVPVLQPVSIRKDGPLFINQAQGYGPFDIGVVVAFGQILPLAVLQLPAAGCVNVHASLLPRWRGAAPMQRAIISGDSSTGVCLMQMEAGLDTGPVFVCQETEISDEDNLETLHDRLAVLGAELLLKHLESIAKGQIKPFPQSPEGMIYAPRIDPQEGRIDWQRSAREILNQVRGLSPSPGAFTILEQRRLKIFKAEIADSPASGFPSGTVVSIKEDRLGIQCGIGVLELLEVQQENKKRLTAAEFMRGFPIKTGVKLG